MVRGTFGGKKLKLLRERSGFSQLALELQGVVSQRHLSKIETGKTYRPQWETLDTMLGYYGASFNESQEILKSFGYLPEYPLPTEDEVAAIMEQVQPVLDSVSCGAYIVDYIARLHGFNNAFLRLSGATYEALSMWKGRPLWEARMKASAEPDADTLEEFRQMRQELAIYEDEPWFASFIKERGETFVKCWQTAGELPDDESSPVAPLTARIMNPAQFEVNGIALQFYATEQRLHSDNRLRLVSLIPANIAAMQWSEEQTIAR